MTTLLKKLYHYKFYNGRKEAKRVGDRAKDLLYKLRLNSLYGKFGSDYRKYENFFILPDSVDDLDGWGKVGDFGEHSALFSKPLDDSEMKFYNVATAASITGFVRAYWLAAAVNVGFDNLLYGDTDSMAVLAGSEKRLSLGNELGQWKDEGLFCRAGIAGKKMYIFRKDKSCPIYLAEKKKDSKTMLHKTASKGVRLSDAELWRVCSGKTVKHRKDSPSYSVLGKVCFTERNVKITI